MALDNSIDNPTAGLVWLATGIVGTLWLNRLTQQVRKDVGGWRRYWFGPEPNAEARTKVVALNVKVWTCVAVWLAMYLILDWLF